MNNSVKVLHDTKRQMFYIPFEGREIENSPFVEYEAGLKQSFNFTHTFTPEDLRGQGLAGIVVAEALEYCRKNDITVENNARTCSYVAKKLGSDKT